MTDPRYQSSDKELTIKNLGLYYLLKIWSAVGVF